MNRFLVIAVLYLFFSTPVVAGQFYQYKNADGTLIFTDDLSQVPEDQRPGVRSYESVINKEVEPPGESVTDQQPHSVDARLEPNEKDPKWYNEEGERLNREKKALLAIKKDVNTPEKRSEYNRRVNALNQQIEAYKIKLEQFKKSLSK